MKFADSDEVPFPVGVMYYRGPVPKRDCWDGDFARIRAAGFRIIRIFTYWNSMEPSPGVYDLDDIDSLFDVAAKHDLKVWLDVVLATHGACPEWLTRENPDMRVVTYRGDRLLGDAQPAYPQGAMIHCYDHPAWREYGGGLLRHVVRRYMGRPNMHIWGLWDGINIASAWSPLGGADGYPCYCEYTLAKYDGWLRQQFTLDELNVRLLRKYRRWEDVKPPRSNQNVVEMLLYRQFHYENLASQLAWMVGEAKRIDPDHETRSHGSWMPRPWDEYCASEADSWGMSMSSNNLLTSKDPYKISDRAFSFDWSRSVGREGRWWNEEIYAGMSPGGVTWKKQSDPHELTMLLWMSLAGGAVGAMFWQYRPEYLSFESPGYNLMRLDGEPTIRFDAVSQAVSQIEAISEYLPIECPRADVAVVYHPSSQELFGYNDENERFLTDLRGVYRTLWSNGIPTDVVTPKMDWSEYRLLFLPNVALMDEETQGKIGDILDSSQGPQIIAEGSFGMYSGDGQSSYRPPEGFSDRLGVRVADVSAVDQSDIEAGRNVVETLFGSAKISSQCGYALLEPGASTLAIASLGGETVGVRTADRRFTWYGLTLSAGFGGVGLPEIVLGHVKEAGVTAPVETQDDGLVPVVRRSSKGGWLLFLFNLRGGDVEATVRPKWRIKHAEDLLTRSEVSIKDGALQVMVKAWDVGVIHCEDLE